MEGLISRAGIGEGVQLFVSGPWGCLGLSFGYLVTCRAMSMWLRG